MERLDMNKYNFTNTALSSAILSGLTEPRVTVAEQENIDKVVVERYKSGKLHEGKVLVAVQANLSDIPRLSGGTCAKLINEGYTGYLVRTSNDEKSGSGSVFQNINSTEKENAQMASILGFTDVFNFYYKHLRMNGRSPLDIRGRLILLFRYLKPDTVISYVPSSREIENPDRVITGRVLEEACLMAGLPNYYPEHLDGGLAPHYVNEKYYAITDPLEPFNRVVDISSTLEQKIEAIAACKSAGGNSGSVLRKHLTEEGKRLPILGNNEKTADRAYIRQFILAPFKQIGEQFGLEYAERFRYTSRESKLPFEIEEYIKKYAEEL
jgi:LmbE family N-acetylglucosaminyl deacetylase